MEIQHELFRISHHFLNSTGVNVIGVLLWLQAIATHALAIEING
jgi:hypothetical protein